MGGFAANRDARNFQVTDVPIDGSLGDTQLVRQLLAGGASPSAEELHQLKEPIGAAHTALLFPGSSTALAHQERGVHKPTG